MEVDDGEGAGTQENTLVGSSNVSRAGGTLVENSNDDAASSGSFSVRCAHGSERAVIDELYPNTSVGELRLRLADRFGVPVAQQTNVILRGRNLTKVGDETTLASAGLDAGFKGRLVLAGTTVNEAERFKAEEEAVLRHDAALQRARPGFLPPICGGHWRWWRKSGKRSCDQRREVPSSRAAAKRGVASGRSRTCRSPCSA